MVLSYQPWQKFVSLAAWFPRGFLCTSPSSHLPGDYGTVHSAATGKYREPA